MSGIAELLVNLGYEVSGSDMQRTEITDRLASLGARIAQGHDARNVRDAEVVVYSSAVRAVEPGDAAARERGLASFREPSCSPSSCGCGRGSRLPGRTAKRRPRR